jgi:hypothetical protein
MAAAQAQAEAFKELENLWEDVDPAPGMFPIQRGGSS